MLELLNEIRADKKLANSTKWTDGNKILEGPLSRAGDEMLKYASQYTVSEDQIQDRIADMINTVGTLCLLTPSFPLNLERKVSFNSIE